MLGVNTNGRTVAVETPTPIAPTPEATPEATPEGTPDITCEATPAPAMPAPTTTSVPTPAPTAGRGSLADEPTCASSCAVYAATGGAASVLATATAARDRLL